MDADRSRDAKLALDGRSLRPNWKRPKWPYIEPLKDAQADDLRISRNLESPTIVHGERGRDWRDVSREIVRDRSLHIRNAMTEAARINSEFPGSGVTWRDLAGDWRDAKIAPQSPEDSSDASGGDRAFRVELSDHDRRKWTSECGTVTLYCGDCGDSANYRAGERGCGGY